MMKIEHRATIELPSRTTFGEIQQMVAEADIPNDAQVRVEHYAGDQRDPAYTKLIFIW